MTWVQLRGFDEEVDFILQPKGKYLDVPKINLYGAPNLIRINSSAKLYIPIEYDIYIAYAPLKHNLGITSSKGIINLKAKMIDSKALMF